MAMELTSPAFTHQGIIPEIFTCHGKDISPELQWKNIPSGTKSLALIVDDPDAPMGLWVHWVVYNISPDSTGFAENVASGEKGLNTWGKTGYGGPCPPSGIHRYYFKLYALDTMLPKQAEPPTAEQLEKLLKEHILAQAELMGRFGKD